MFRTIRTHNTQNIESYLIFLRIHKLKKIMDTQHIRQKQVLDTINN